MDKKKLTDIICVSLVSGAVAITALLNIVQPNRPTVSEAEKRQLKTLPEFSVSSLTDGSYFSGVSEFISDTFIGRDKLVSLSKEIDTFTGIDYKLGGDESFVLLTPTDSGATVENTTEEDTSASDALAQAFNELNNRTENETSVSDFKPESPDEEDNSGSGNVAVSGAVIEEESESENEEASTVDTSEPEENTPSEQEPSETTDEQPSETPTEEEPEPTETPTEENPETDTTEPVEETKEEEPEYYVKSLTLSKSSITLTVGSGSVVNAYLDTNMDDPGSVKWSISNSKVASISLNESGGINVKGVSEGTATLTCRYGDEFKVTCGITVQNITSVTQTQNDAEADFLASGLFIYGDAVYTQAYYSASSAGYYAQTAAYYKQLFGDNTRVNVIVAPVSAIVIDNPTVTSKIADQQDILNKMKALMDPSINFVDTYTNLYAHRSEYLFFKSDHHWTQRGAYYAYAAFAESIGLTPTPLDKFDYQIRNDSYQGSMYLYTQDARVKTFYDTIEAFYPTKKHTMTVTSSTGAVYTYDSSITQTNNTYVTFIGGDNPYTVINVPDNPQDFNCIVLKDSFGNAFVPYLCEHYGNIFVVDVRYSTFNIYDLLKDYGIDDIIIVNNIQAANSMSWSKMYLSAVGVALQ